MVTWNDLHGLVNPMGMFPLFFGWNCMDRLQWGGGPRNFLAGVAFVS